MRPLLLTTVRPCTLDASHLNQLLTSDSFFSADLMDKDIRAALFDGFDEEGEFEELQDDFITQVLLSTPFSY